jgi:hypothetical protein
MNVTKTTAHVHIRSKIFGSKKRSTKSILKQLTKYKRKVKRG